ncbi:hypothetical protein AGOR_G00198380 [Albula goreensis]|uniref:Platelet-derived growth factor subunit B n=1 Tax=Albula goreensis TaxID=1534307 RepID=A0A8T3CNG2_9TELE|nr:hypothetical protein AGOR_G00198380 [Albula goreensis]
MSSWVLLLAALAACVRFVSTEGDPLPPALVELVRNSPISSIQDLQLLLAPDSVDEDADSQTAKYHQNNGTSKRVRRSIAAEQAQQAQCKVRTEVLEVTRDMLDRRNANFLLWPPCVEVQRCSGCCNSRAVQCVPTVTDTRYLQVMKIQYINKRAHYEKAIISVQDHVECRCQISAAPRIMAIKPQNTPQPHRLVPKTPTVKTPSKEELHRHDVLKQNQNPRPDDKESLWHAKRVHPHSPAVQNQMPSHSPSTERQVHTERTPLRGTQTRGDSIPHEEDRKWEEHKAHLGEQERKLPDPSGVGSTKRPLTEEQPPHTHRHRHQEAGPRHSMEHDISAHRTASTCDDSSHHNAGAPHPAKPPASHLTPEKAAQKQEEDEQGSNEGSADVKGENTQVRHRQANKWILSSLYIQK